MRLLDWAVVVAYLVWIVSDGLRRSKGTHAVEGYFLANRSLPWWAVGLSVMATQMSAITLVGTTGRGYAEGLSVVQLYFGLPIAMVILSITVVPFFYRAGVFTAYEYLERRFDARTRSLASFLFIVNRAMSCGVAMSAPGVILSIVFGWNLTLTTLAIGLPAVLYTMVGGVQAVTWADVKQIGVVLSGVTAAVVVAILGLPDGVSVGQAFHLAGATGRLQAIDFTPDLTRTYTFWSGTIAALFQYLSYFGCDQSQVQRFLTAKSVNAGRESLLVSAYAKIPLQFVIPLIGVLVFVFYIFQPPPLLFNRVHDAQVRSGPRAGEYAALESEYARAFTARREAASAYAAAASTDEAALTAAKADFRARDREMATIRGRASTVVQESTGDTRFGDVNYIFPTFVVQQMPIGLVGLIVAAIFAAAMSAVAGELNAVSTAFIIDFYKRRFKPEGTDREYLRASKLATGAWGLFACVVALYAPGLGPLIDVVNRFGSFFYGSLLGVFVLALGVPRATARGAFWGLIAGMAAVAAVAYTTSIAFLWYNVVGVVVVVAVGLALSLTQPRRS